ncbi:unnamed protein product [Heligmosomoides polygyrus]|uniref:Uncharacterized protein n=1 Tax=Heligmosomoides polygyrus TaxID=6339 RepID=A0A183GEP0_HELPZ|nr:unnamed protein product [Heligmosomoides polygyrus]
MESCPPTGSIRQTKSRVKVLMSVGGRFFRCSGVILSGPSAVRFFIDEMESDLRRENRGNDVSILRKMAWEQVDVAIEEIGVEILDDLLHGPPGRGDGFVGTSESGHLGLEVGEDPAGIADTERCLFNFGQHFRPSPFRGRFA